MTAQPLPMSDWNTCEHEWIDHDIETHASKEECTQVVCRKCGCPGERGEVTGEIYWPAT